MTTNSALDEAREVIESAARQVFEGHVCDVFWALSKVTQLINSAPRPLSTDDRCTIRALHARLRDLADHIESTGITYEI